jgi:hypothetical protein
MNPLLALIVLGAVILVGSAIATGVEAAILTVNPIQVHTLGQDQGQAGAGAGLAGGGQQPVQHLRLDGAG